MREGHTGLQPLSHKTHNLIRRINRRPHRQHRSPLHQLQRNPFPLRPTKLPLRNQDSIRPIQKVPRRILKIPTPGSSTLKYKSGRRNRRILFDSITTFSAPAISFRIRGIATARSPVRVLTQNDRTAPAARYLPESVVESPPTRSSLTATVCSAVSQSHGSPFAEHIPCPNCVTLKAVHRISGIAEISPATTLVFPIFLVCPPTTTIAITAPSIHHPKTTTSPQKHHNFTIKFDSIIVVSAAPDLANTPSKAAPAAPRKPHLPPHFFSAQNSCPTPQNHAFSYSCMLSNPHLPPQNRPILDHTRPRNPRLRRNHNILSYQAVMPNMHQIINLSPLAQSASPPKPPGQS